MATEAKRLADVEPGEIPDGFSWIVLSYWRVKGRGWRMNLPGAGLGNLDGHDVQEHDDGTITVSPSILVTGAQGRRHGYLRRGWWEPCGDDQPPEEVRHGEA